MFQFIRFCALYITGLIIFTPVFKVLIQNEWTVFALFATSFVCSFFLSLLLEIRELILKNREIISGKNKPIEKPYDEIILGGKITPEKFRANLAEGKGCRCTPDMQSYRCPAGMWCIHKITPVKRINDR